MKQGNHKRSAVIAVTIVSLLTFCLLLGAGSAEKSSQFEEEMEGIVSGAEGAIGVLIKMGMYESPDGTIDVLSEQDLQKQIDSFDMLVDEAYSKDSSSNGYYKWLHEDLLRVGKRNSNDHCFDAGVLGTSVLAIRINDQNDKATLDAIITAWNKRINDEGGVFTVECPINRTHVEMDLVKEEGRWKVIDVPVFDPIDSGFDLDSIELASDTYKNLSEGIANPLSMELKNNEKEIEQRIQANEKLLAGEYSSYSEALIAAQAIDVYYSYYAFD